MRIFNYNETSVVYANNNDLSLSRLTVVTTDPNFDELAFRSSMLAQALIAVNPTSIHTCLAEVSSPYVNKTFEEMTLDEFSEHARQAIREIGNCKIEVIRI